MPLTREDLNVI